MVAPDYGHCRHCMSGCRAEQPGHDHYSVTGGQVWIICAACAEASGISAYIADQADTAPDAGTAHLLDELSATVSDGIPAHTHTRTTLRA